MLCHGVGICFFTINGGNALHRRGLSVLLFFLFSPFPIWLPPTRHFLSYSLPIDFNVVWILNRLLPTSFCVLLLLASVSFCLEILPSFHNGLSVTPSTSRIEYLLRSFVRHGAVQSISDFRYGLLKTCPLYLPTPPSVWSP